VTLAPGPPRLARCTTPWPPLRGDRGLSYRVARRRTPAAPTGGSAVLPVDAAPSGRLPGRAYEDSGRGGGGPSCPTTGRHGAQPSPAEDQQPGPRRSGHNKTIAATRHYRNRGEVLYDADACNGSWLPTRLRHVEPAGSTHHDPPSRAPYKRDGLGAGNDQTGEPVVGFRRHTRRREVAERLQALVDTHPTGIISVA
jgi:hypothetical protein